MGTTMEEELKKVEAQPTPAPEPPLASAPNDVAEEKAASLPPPPGAAAAADESKALAVVEAESKFSVKWKKLKLCYVVKTKKFLAFGDRGSGNRCEKAVGRIDW